MALWLAIAIAFFWPRAAHEPLFELPQSPQAQIWGSIAVIAFWGAQIAAPLFFLWTVPMRHLLAAYLIAQALVWTLLGVCLLPPTEEPLLQPYTSVKWPSAPWHFLPIFFVVEATWPIIVLSSRW